MNHSDNYFQLFQIDESFTVDITQLTERYRALQKVLHPDNFAGASDRERRLSVQQSSIVNDAFTVLKTPVARAKYLLQLNGMDVDDENNNIMDPMFLMQQMELRESLEEVGGVSDPLQALEDLADDLSARMKMLQSELQVCFESGDIASYEQAAQLVHKLQFFIKLQEEIDAQLARLD